MEEKPLTHIYINCRTFSIFDETNCHTAQVLYFRIINLNVVFLASLLCLIQSISLQFYKCGVCDSFYAFPPPIYAIHTVRLIQTDTLLSYYVGAVS